MCNDELGKLNDERHKLARERRLRGETGIDMFIDDINQEKRFYSKNWERVRRNNSVEIDIMKVDKDTATLTTGNGERIFETTAVAYTVNVKVGGCSIRGSFEFSDNEFTILNENVVKQKIRNLFKEKD